MSSDDLKVVVDLFNAHLATINIAIYVVGGAVTVLAILVAVFTWKSIKAAIHIKVEAEVEKLAELERPKIKTLIENTVQRISEEEGTSLYVDIQTTLYGNSQTKELKKEENAE